MHRSRWRSTVRRGAGSGALAAAEAVRAHAALTIVSVVAPFTAPIGQNVEGWVEAEQYVEARRDLAQGAVDVALDLAVELAPGVSIDGEVIDGKPTLVLRELSSRVRMIVVGRRGLGGVAGLLLGSVSSDIAAHGSCPVAVVGPQARVRPCRCRCRRFADIDRGRHARLPGGRHQRNNAGCRAQLWRIRRWCLLRAG